ncbi:GCN5-related N-acetyl-transferase-domain-containing protein [Spinellus fusiger]|nr:GCN5-related N-acetyl-transferase-domain-containing protein [Spinellus fusiger]
MIDSPRALSPTKPTFESTPVSNLFLLPRYTPQAMNQKLKPTSQRIHSINSLTSQTKPTTKRRSSEIHSKYVQTEDSAPIKMRVVSGQNLIGTVGIPTQWMVHASSTATVAVVHDTQSCMFKIALDSQGSIAALCYLPTRFQAILEFYHTEIPPHYRNMGLGDKLAQEAFRWLQHSNRLMIPTCPFVLRYLDRHFQDRSSGSWTCVVRSEQEGVEKLMRKYKASV